VKTVLKRWTWLACLGLGLAVYSGCNTEESAPESQIPPNQGAPKAPPIVTGAGPSTTPTTTGTDADKGKIDEKKDETKKTDDMKKADDTKKADETPKKTDDTKKDEPK